MTVSPSNSPPRTRVCNGSMYSLPEFQSCNPTKSSAIGTDPTCQYVQKSEAQFKAKFKTSPLSASITDTEQNNRRKFGNSERILAISDERMEKDTTNPFNIPVIIISAPEDVHGEKIHKIYQGTRPFLTPPPSRSPSIPTPQPSSSIAPIHQDKPTTMTTYITIEYKSRPGDSLFICGSGPNMAWEKEKALPLRYIGYSTWIYEGREQDFNGFEYRLVLNKEIWEKWGVRKVIKGKVDRYIPEF